MVKKLRYYARFIVVCLLLKKMKIVRELVRVRLVLETSLMYCFISIYFCLRNCPNMWMSTPALTNQTTSWNGPWCWVKLSLSSKQMPFSIFWMQIPIPWSSLTGTSSSFFCAHVAQTQKEKERNWQPDASDAFVHLSLMDPSFLPLLFPSPDLVH